MRQVLLIDKDSTLVDINFNLYQGATEFIKEESKKREIVIATTAGDKGKAHLKPIWPYLSGYYGGDQLSSSGYGFYYADDGTIRKIEDDYDDLTFTADTPYHRKLYKYNALYEELLKTIETLHNQEKNRPDYKEVTAEIGGEVFTYPEKSLINNSDLETEYDRLWNEKRRIEKLISDLNKNENPGIILIHKITKQPFDWSKRYVNPNTKNRNGFKKDLYLLKKLYAPTESDPLKTVMIGNYSDWGATMSEPKTPLIMVTPVSTVNSLDAAPWLLRNSTRILLDKLYQAGEVFPHQVFDQLYALGRQTAVKENIYTDAVIVEIDNVRFQLNRNSEFGYRGIDERPVEEIS